MIDQVFLTWFAEDIRVTNLHGAVLRVGQTYATPTETYGNIRAGALRLIVLRHLLCQRGQRRRASDREAASNTGKCTWCAEGTRRAATRRRRATTGTGRTATSRNKNAHYCCQQEDGHNAPLFKHK